MDANMGAEFDEGIPLPTPGSDAPKEPAPALLEVFSPSRIHFVGGSNHSGKSTLMAQLAQAMVQGTSWGTLAPSPPVPPEKLIFLFTDRMAEDNMAWVKAAGLSDIKMYSAVDDSDYCARLKAGHFKAHPVPGFSKFLYVTDKLKVAEDSILIIDVMTNQFTGDVLKINDVSDHMTLLANYCLQRRWTVVGTGYGVKITEDTKARYARKVDRIIGASTFRGAISTLCYLTTPAESGLEGLQELEMVPRGARKPIECLLERGEGGWFYIKDGLRASDSSSSVIGAVRALFRASPGPLAARDVVLALTIPKAIVNTYIQRLLQKGEIKRTTRGLYAWIGFSSEDGQEAEGAEDEWN
jgi:hypothetical protein